MQVSYSKGHLNLDYGFLQLGKENKMLKMSFTCLLSGILMGPKKYSLNSYY